MTPMKRPALLVEDDVLLAEMVALSLSEMNLEVRKVYTFPDARDALLSGAYELAVVDVMLPGGDGFELARLARQRGLEVPIVLLTARDDVAAKVHGLDCGADDYITKPFHTEEFLARVRAVLRRRTSGPSAKRLELAPWWVDLESGLAHTREGELVLSQKELAVMRLFVAREGEPLSRSDMLDAAWGQDVFPTDRTIDNFIVRLRRLFERDPAEPKRFVTLRSRGYLFRREA
jgi:two-component system, OmpR family, alkaline phosphatase synthesis response regulator PhoP